MSGENGRQVQLPWHPWWLRRYRIKGGGICIPLGCPHGAEMGHVRYSL